MTQKPEQLFSKFTGHLKTLGYTRNNLEIAYRNDQIKQRDIEQVYKGLFLEAFSSLELLIENLFLELVIGEPHPSCNAQPRVEFPSKQAARMIIFGGKKYVNWLHIENTIKISKRFIIGQNPFKELKAHKQKLDDITIIRNALAHTSGYSQKKFKHFIKNNFNSLGPHERRPTSYLRSIYAMSPRQSHYDYQILNFAAVAQSICT